MSKIITPEAQLSYPHLFTPQAAEDGGQEKYSCALVFFEGTDITALQRAAIETAVEKWGEKAKEQIKKGQLRLPFRKGEEKDYADGSIFINVRGNRRPGIVSLIPDPKTGKPMAITDPEEVYAGCFVRASLTPFAYDTSGNKGVSFGLNNLQKIRDGERLDSRAAAEDEFEADASAVASLEDLADEGAQEDEAPATKPVKAPKATKAAPVVDELAELLK